MNDFVNRIYCADSKDLSFIPDGSIDLIVTSPPYNAKIKYDVYNDNQSIEDFEQMLFDVFSQCFSKLKHGGRMAINVTGIGRKPYLFLPHRIEAIIESISDQLLNRGVVIWNKGASVGQSCAWGSWRSPSNPSLRDVHEYILIYSKGDYRLQHKGESDLTSEEFTTWTKAIWDIPTVSAKRMKHPAPFPFELVKRLIKLYTYKDAIVLDPFNGIGTTCMAAKAFGRNWIGVDISQNYCDLAESNLKEVEFNSGTYTKGTKNSVQ